jgi:hypothetical protein
VPQPPVVSKGNVPSAPFRPNLYREDIVGKDGAAFRDLARSAIRIEFFSSWCAILLIKPYTKSLSSNGPLKPFAVIPSAAEEARLVRKALGTNLGV